MGSAGSKDDDESPNPRAESVRSDAEGVDKNMDKDNLPSASRPRKGDVPPRDVGRGLQNEQSNNGGVDVKPGLRALREDCCSPAHGKLFSSWKVLVGSSDWQQYREGAEGAQRYRSENLPKDYFGPGIYELAILCPPQNKKPTSRSRFRLGRRQTPATTRPREDIIVTYVGKADNIRTRLQQHGRGASHLEGQVPEARISPSKSKSPTTGKVSGVDGDVSPLPGGGAANLGLFSQVFARGGTIMFRWKVVGSREAALFHESALLAEYDYAWNRMENGARRLLDIDRRLDGLEAEAWAERTTWERWLCIGVGRRGRKGRQKGASQRAKSAGKQVQQTGDLARQGAGGVSSGGSRQGLSSSGGAANAGQAWRGSPAAKVKVSAAIQRPAAVLQVCGIETHAGPCKEIPMEGRKRCVEHKGRRMRASTTAGLVGGVA